MTVQTEISRSGPYAGAGTTGPFTVGFRFLDNSHLQVIRTDSLGVNTTLTLNVDYSVSGAGADTGTVTLASALAVGNQLTIIRNVPFTQEADYVENDSFPAESHEMALDKLTMETQQLKEAQDRALTLPPTAPSVSTELPSPTASAVIGWNSDADKLVNVPLSSLATQIIGNTYQVDYFNGTGAQNSFTLSADPGGTNAVFVSVGGVEQRPLIDYAVTGSAITFMSGAPPAGTNNVMVKYGTAVTTIGQASSVTGQTLIGTQLITAPDAATARTAINAVGLTGNETIAGTKTFSTRPIVGTPSASTDDTSAASTAFANRAALNAAAAAAVSTQGLFRALTGSATGLSALVSYTIGELITGDNAGSYQVARNWSGSINMTVLGVGGLDVGTVAADTWYYGYGITKPDGTKGFIASLSSTSPSFANAAGYTKWARIGSFRTDPTANKFPLSFIQFGRKFRYKLDAASNVPIVPIMSSGVVSSPGTGANAVSVSAFVPPTAAFITLLLSAQNASATMLVFPNTATVTYGNAQLMVSGNSVSGNSMGDIALESSNIYYAANAAQCLLRCAGWEENL